MTGQVDQKLLDRIQALMARSQRGQHESDEAYANRTGEVDNSLAMARKLMAQHGIELMDLPDGEARLKSDVGHEKVDFGKGSAFGKGWCSMLAHAIDKCCYTGHIFFSTEGKLAFIGSATEVAVATKMYVHIADQAADLCRIARGAKGLKGGSSPYKQFTLDFMTGIVQRIDQRLKEEIALENSQAGTALVRLTEERNNEYSQSTFIDQRNLTFKGRAQTQAFINGWRQGENVELQRKERLEGVA